MAFEWEKNVFDAYSRLRLHVQDDESLERDVELLAAECRQAHRLRRWNDRLRAALRAADVMCRKYEAELGEQQWAWVDDNRFGHGDVEKEAT